MQNTLRCAALAAAFMLATSAACTPLSPASDESSSALAPADPRTPWPIGTRIICSGHSLVDPFFRDWPGRLGTALELNPNGDRSQLGKATIPGSPISWRWTNAESPVDWPAAMPSYGALFITTGVPLIEDDARRKTRTVDWFVTAAVDAWTNGNGRTNDNGRDGAPTLLWTTWAHLNDPNAQTLPTAATLASFRQRLNEDEPRWEEMQDAANSATRPAGSTPVYLCPGHRFMMRLYDDIHVHGTAPFNSITEVFMDEPKVIHPNQNIGRYAISVLGYACMYGRDPTELPDRLHSADTLTPAQAQYFKRIAREVITGYPRTGLSQLTGSVAPPPSPVVDAGTPGDASTPPAPSLDAGVSPIDSGVASSTVAVDAPSGDGVSCDDRCAQDGLTCDRAGTAANAYSDALITCMAGYERVNLRRGSCIDADHACNWAWRGYATMCHCVP